MEEEARRIEKVEGRVEKRKDKVTVLSSGSDRCSSLPVLQPPFLIQSGGDFLFAKSLNFPLVTLITAWNSF